MLLYQGEPELPYDSFDVIVDALAAASQDRVIVVEGVGVTQARMRSALDFKIWVQTDAEVAKERGLLRDLAEQQSWLVADFRISGQA
jgi:uridine kinase